MSIVPKLAVRKTQTLDTNKYSILLKLINSAAQRHIIDANKFVSCSPQKIIYVLLSTHYTVVIMRCKVLITFYKKAKNYDLEQTELLYHHPRTVHI